MAEGSDPPKLRPNPPSIYFSTVAETESENPAVADSDDVRFSGFKKVFRADGLGKHAEAHENVGGQLLRFVEMFSISGVGKQLSMLSVRIEEPPDEVMAHFMGKCRTDRSAMMRGVHTDQR